MLVRTTLAAVTLTLIPSHPLAPADAHQPRSSSLDPTVLLVGADDGHRTHALDVLDRFRAAGLALPDLVVRFADDSEACGGHDGLFRESVAPWEIVICTDLPYVLPHELAHAWEAANLTEDARAAFAERFGFETWDGRDAAWRDRGEEHAAYVIQQNLMVTSGRSDSPRWVERAEAYEMLTGLPSPRRR